jgi:hypothetical protein
MNDIPAVNRLDGSITSNRVIRSRTLSDNVTSPGNVNLPTRIFLKISYMPRDRQTDRVQRHAQIDEDRYEVPRFAGQEMVDDQLPTNK